MKVFLFGKNGMLGNTLLHYLAKHFSVVAFDRQDFNPLLHTVSDLESLFEKNSISENDIVINCIGVIPQRKPGSEMDYFIVNSKFPHLLANTVSKQKAHLLHISTNCVFSSSPLPRDEMSFPDAKDVYGLSKYLGEPPNTTIIRTSIIGEEKESNVSLLNWVLSSQSPVNGYANHMWNGVTCLQVAKYIHQIIDTNTFWIGIRHLYSNDSLSKKDLLELICSIYEKPIEINSVTTEYPISKLLTSNYPLLLESPSLSQQILEQKEFFQNIKIN